MPRAPAILDAAFGQKSSIAASIDGRSALEFNEFLVASRSGALCRSHRSYTSSELVFTWK